MEYHHDYCGASEALFQFIAESPSCFHAADRLEAMLLKGGFTRLELNRPWALAAGGKYYVVSNGSALLAFTLPTLCYQGFHIVASHSDAPCFKIKENPEIACEKSYTTLNVEAYGGMLCAPWFDRPLSIAGRVVLLRGGRLETRLVNFERDLVSIVNLAIHMNRDANKGMAYQIQKDMLPLWAGEADGITLKQAVAQQLKVEETEIADMDLFLYNRMPGTVWGANEEFISAPRLDDLQCAFSSVQALLHAENPNQVCMAAIFDNEEVGSGTKQGALSTLLVNTLRRINAAAGRAEEAWQISLANSFLLSADNGHALHPNYPEKCDKTNHPRLNGGVVIKYAANQKYTTDAQSGAKLRAIFADAGVPYQVFYNHSDIPGGSTLGNLSTQQVSLPAADIGTAMLAMHSPYETGGVQDTLWMIEAMQAFFKAE